MSGGHTHALYHHGQSLLHDLVPQVKLASLVLFIVAVVATPREAFWAFGVYTLLVIASAVAGGVPAGFVARRLLIEIPFVIFAVLLPFVGGGERTTVLGLSLSVEGLWGGWNILAKGTLGLIASIVMAATTQVADILTGLDRLRVPRLITAIASFMVRYLDVIAAEFRRQQVAMLSRGYDPRWIWQAKALATSAGALFIRSYERGERVHQAMIARGYRGRMPMIDQRPASVRDWAVALSVPAVAWLVALLALLAGWR